MKSRRIGRVVKVLAVFCFPVCLLSQDLTEGDTLVRNALDYVIQFSSETGLDEDRVYDEDELPGSWAGFLGGDMTNGWTLAKKIDAFRNYLVHMSSTNCVVLPANEKQQLRAALLQCDVLEFTNCLPAMKMLVRNSEGLYRHEAISLCVKYGMLSDEMTSFVESIVTNQMSFSLRERSRACCEYARFVKEMGHMPNFPLQVKKRAVEMLYRRSRADLVGTQILDKLFVQHIPRYEMSSNRLEFANYVIDHVQVQERDRIYFTSVTNQLLSSDQPLWQLMIGEGGNE